MLDKSGAVPVIEMECNLAVGLGGKTVALFAQRVPDRLVPIEFAIDDNIEIAAAMAERLIAVFEPDNAQADVAQRGQPVIRKPGGAAIRPAMGNRV